MGSNSVARALAVLDADDAGAPALMQRAGADPERGDGADAGDDDLAAHEPRLHHQVDGVADGLDLADVVALERPRRTRPR